MSILIHSHESTLIVKFGSETSHSVIANFEQLIGEILNYWIVYILYWHLFFRMELNGFNTAMLIIGLQHPENEHERLVPTIQDCCFIIRTMNKTNDINLWSN